MLQPCRRLLDAGYTVVMSCIMEVSIVAVVPMVYVGVMSVRMRH